MQTVCMCTMLRPERTTATVLLEHMLSAPLHRVMWESMFPLSKTLISAQRVPLCKRRQQSS